SSVYRVAQQLRGRVLGSLVKEGMTRKQVERILGVDRYSLPTWEMSGGIIWESAGYDELGLRVMYCSESNKETRVTFINFCYLFDPGPGFWAAVANPPYLGREFRVRCLHYLVRCYVSRGMKLSEVGRILRHATWLDEREIHIYTEREIDADTSTAF